MRLNDLEIKKDDKRPVLKFYYKGNHSHPVRRTVLLIEETSNSYIGYELREGREIRSPKEALQSIKVYYKNLISNYGDYCRLKMSKANAKKPNKKSTLERFPVKQLLNVM